MVSKLLNNTLFRNISSLSLIQIANYAVPILLIPYIGRIVGIENYGKLEYARAFVFYFTILVDYGFDFTVTREISVNRENKSYLNKLVSEVYYSKITLFLIATLIFVGLTLIDPKLNKLSWVLTVTYLINIGFVLFPMWFFQGIEKIASIAYLAFFIKIFILSMVFFLLRTPEDYWIYNVLQSLSQILAGCMALYIVVNKYHIRFQKVDFKAILLRIKKGFAVFASILLGALIATYSFMLMKGAVSDIDLGSYSTAFKLAITIQTLILIPFSQAFYPFTAKKASENIYEFKALIRKAFWILMAINLFIIVISYIFAPLIIRILFGEAYESVVYPFRVLVFSPFFACLTNLFSYQGLLNLKRDKEFLYLHLFFAATTIGLSHWIVPSFGLTGAVFLRNGLEFGMMLTSFFLFRKHLKRRMYEGS